jgi:hypothetical protein
MLLFEIKGQEKRKWKDVPASERLTLLRAIFKGKSAKNPIAASEIESWLNKKGIEVSKRSIDKELEKAEYREFDFARPQGTKLDNPNRKIKK